MTPNTEDLQEKPRPRERAPAESPVPGSAPLATTDAHLPATRPVWRRRLDRRRIVQVAALAIFAGLSGAGGVYWWKQAQAQLPPGIMSSNGRIEADEIDIDTKFAGRIAQLMVDEGDMVAAGQLVARMDTQDLQQSLAKANAQVAQARRILDEAQANVAQQRAVVTLAEQQMNRARELLKNGWITRETFDQRQQVLDGARAGLDAASAKAAQAGHALEAAQHDVNLYEVNIADNGLVAPRDGRIQYRVANVGEVLPAGGKVFTMLDVSYVYMDIYLPTRDVGTIKVGSDARIVLDAYPDVAIPAKVSFIATQAQFTPKMVETKSERDKLMFRVRVRIDPDRLRRHADAVRSGLPGLAYVRADGAVAWPARLQGKNTP
jgi:HlyD family secretion protein